MVGIVLVSHSALIAEGTAQLARQMGGDAPIAAAGGIDDPDDPIGTDATKVLAAIDEVWSEDGVVVLMDLGSAILSADFALEMLDDHRRSRVVLCEAPLVEGAVAAATAAGAGLPLDGVLAEARAALLPKASGLGIEPGGGLRRSNLRPGRQATMLRRGTAVLDRGEHHRAPRPPRSPVRGHRLPFRRRRFGVQRHHRLGTGARRQLQRCLHARCPPGTPGGGDRRRARGRRQCSPPWRSSPPPGSVTRLDSAVPPPPSVPALRQHAPARPQAPWGLRRGPSTAPPGTWRSPSWKRWMPPRRVPPPRSATGSRPPWRRCAPPSRNAKGGR